MSCGRFFKAAGVLQTRLRLRRLRWLLRVPRAVVAGQRALRRKAPAVARQEKGGERGKRGPRHQQGHLAQSSIEYGLASCAFKKGATAAVENPSPPPPTPQGLEAAEGAAPSDRGEVQLGLGCENYIKKQV
jgi:hypothetical protein